MTQISDELLCGDDVNVIYGDDWYFNMAEIYLTHSDTFNETSPIVCLNIKTLKDAA